MANIENIIPNGSKINTKIGHIEALVIGVCVRGVNNDSIEYHIAYFLNGDYKTCWVHSFEIAIKIDNSKPMGFASSNNISLIG